MAELSPTASRMFDSLPRYYEGEPTFERLVQAQANEFDRLEAFLVTVAEGFSPAGAIDDPPMLAIWERILQLPIEPAGIPLAQRKQAIVATFLGRRCRTTAEWLAAMNAALGPTTTWSHEYDAPGPGELTINVPYEPGSYLEGIIKTLVRRLTPANYEIVFGFTEGWIAGVSEPGDAA